MLGLGITYFSIVSIFSHIYCRSCSEVAWKVSGHGGQIDDKDGDEEDGKDECQSNFLA